MDPMPILQNQSKRIEVDPRDNRVYTTMIIIYIQRKGMPPSDDRIEIRSQDGVMFNVLYYEQSTERGRNIRHSFTLQKCALINYVFSLLDFLQIDDEPYHGLEFLIPGYPAIVVLLNKLDEYKKECIMRAFRRCVYTFPSTM